MNIQKDQVFEMLVKDRHDLEIDLDHKLILAKKDGLLNFAGLHDKVNQEFLQNVDLQKYLSEARDLIVLIEESWIRYELLQIQVKELEDATETLTDKKEELQEVKKQAEIRNDDLKKELDAKQQAAENRLKAKINRDKNAEVKELIAQEETAKQHNEELQQKLKEE